MAPLFDVGPKRRSLQNLVFKRNTFRIAFLKPGLCGMLGSEDLSLSPTSLLRSKVPGEGIRPVGLIYLILAKHSFMCSSSKRTCASMASCNAAVPLLDNSAEPFCEFCFQSRTACLVVLEGDLYRSIADRLAGRLALSRRPLVLEQGEAGGALASQLARAGVQSLLGLPLILDRQLLGVLYVGRRTHRPFSDDDAALLQLVGDRVALAVDRARLFEQERHIAETLQRSLLPEQLPQDSGAGSCCPLPPGRRGDGGGGRLV